MKVKDYLKTTISALKANKTRSTLTILGIIIGIAAVICMIAVGQGAEKLVISQIASLGSNNIFIEPGPWSERMESGTMMQSMMEEFEIKTLKYEDALAIEELQTVEKTAPVVMGVARVVYANENKKITFFGSTPEISDITDISYDISGRGLTDEDVKSMARVVILGHKTREDLFGEENPIGKTIRIKNVNFKVAGVMGEKGTQALINVDEGLFLPITTAQKLLLGQDFIRLIIVKATSEKVIEEAIYDIRQLLRERHNIYNPEGDLTKDDFKVMSQKETAQIVSSVTSIFTVLLSSIAAISLLVGGVGIMNIMLVSVAERTREIGLRKAVGARSRDILNQFLLESVFLTLLGGILGVIVGVLLSWGTSFVFEYFLDVSWGFFLPLNAILLGVGVSITIGITFGIYPAHKASHLSPIDALRFE